MAFACPALCDGQLLVEPSCGSSFEGPALNLAGVATLKNHEEKGLVEAFRSMSHAERRVCLSELLQSLTPEPDVAAADFQFGIVRIVPDLAERVVGESRSGVDWRLVMSESPSRCPRQSVSHQVASQSRRGPGGSDSLRGICFSFCVADQPNVRRFMRSRTRASCLSTATTREQFREQAGLIDRRLDESFRAQAELIDRLSIVSFNEPIAG